MAGLEKKLEEIRVLLNLTHVLQGEVVQQRIPGMVYADDIALLADNRTDMQRIINITGQEATDPGLNFSAVKSGIMVFNDPTTDAVSIQYGELPRVKQYKYLGVWIKDGETTQELARSNLKVRESETQL